MSRDCSDRITTLFGACARDLTPPTKRHAARVFYAPVSSDPEGTRYCSSILKIRSCFFKADESEMLNCVSDSAAAQHIEASIYTSTNHPINQSGFCCQD
jgi:hypothetical protein